MITPRDSKPEYGVPVNYETGMPLTKRQQGHIQAITEAGDALADAMHMAEGSNPRGEHEEHHWQGRRMAHAATLLETALMFARKAALESE